MSKQVWFKLSEETLSEYSYDLTAESGCASNSHKLNMSNSGTPENSQTVPRLDLNNHTQSTSDSREEESTQNDLSSPSMHRGLSSDDNSGWKSETTETSEGNFSLSQYPLDDQSCGEDSPRENSSLHAEALTSAITEVSNDFISGNFSPAKYPPLESDSSDGDHHVEGHVGAVYARYPESAAGLSDCDWNPYGTDNETPRSSASDSECRKIKPINTASSMMQNDADTRISTRSASCVLPNPTRDFVRIPTGTTTVGESNQFERQDIVKIPDTTSIKYSSVLSQPVKSRENLPGLDLLDKNSRHQIEVSKSDFDYRKYDREKMDAIPASRSLTTDVLTDSYTLYSPEKELTEERTASDQTSTTATGILLGSGDRMSSQTTNQYIPSSYRDKYSSLSHDQLLKDSGDLTGRKSSKQGDEKKSFEAKEIGVSSSSTSVPPESCHTQGSSETVVSSSSVPSTDAVRREIAIKYGSTSSSETSQPSYVPVGDRAKLLGYPEDFLNPLQQTSSTDFAVPRVNDLPLLSRVQIPEKDTLSPSTSQPESMSKRVSKLLEEASQLGTNLHHHLYSREALGLEGNREPTVLRSYSPMRKSDNLTEKSTERSLTPASALLTKSGEQSIRSSLGDEVAKLMMKNEESSSHSLPAVPTSSSYVPLDIGTVPSQEDMNIISAQTYPSLANPAVRGGPGSTDSQESGDSLSQRVRKILADTAYVDRLKNSQNQISGTHTLQKFDYSLLQKDLQEIQNSLEPGDDYNQGTLNPSPDMSKTSDKSVESSKSHKLLWDHGADFGYNDSLSGRFLGTVKTDTETESNYSGGHAYNGLSDTLELVGKSQKESAEVVSDQVESDLDDTHRSQTNISPDVEEIIRRYQTDKPQLEGLMEAGDSSGLASRVMKILSQEPPRKQAYGILESARQEEREMAQNLADKPKLDSSFDSQPSTNSSFMIQDKDVRKQLEWSELSGIDKSINSSYLSVLKSQPFNALGNAKTFLSSQLAKNADRTFNHSIDLKTPYRHVIDCYPVYGVERTRGAAEIDQFGRTEPDGVKEAWTDDASSQDDAAALLLGATSSNTANVRPGSRDHQRTYSDPRELSPEPRIESALDDATNTEDGHSRSKSEEPKYGSDLQRDRFYNLEPVESATDRRAASSPQGRLYNLGPVESATDRRAASSPQGRFYNIEPVESATDRRAASSPQGDQGDIEKDIRRKEQTASTPPSDSSPGSTGQVSLSDSDNSTRRREAARLRPYRPHGSRELYYTEDGEDSMADSVTTVESNHTGSDDAIGPQFPAQFLGSRKDGPPTSTGIYGNRNMNKKDGLSTIDEKSLADEKERSGTDSGVENPRSDLASSHGSISYKRDPGRVSHEDLTGRFSVHSDDKLTLSTRSDPGDQYATPKRSTRYREQSAPRSDNRVYKDIIDQREKGPVKSRSETDLATLPDVEHKYSSPMHGDHFMELSNQPSPIYSHHTSMASPTGIGNRGKNIADKIFEERLHVKPLEKGPEFSHRAEGDTSDRKGEFSLQETDLGLNKDGKPGSTPYNKAYDRQADDIYPVRNMERQEARSLEPGHERLLVLREPVRSLEPGNTREELSRAPIRPHDKISDFHEGQDRESVRSSESGNPRTDVGMDPIRPLDRGPDFPGGQRSEQNVRPLEPGHTKMDINTNPPPHIDTINPGYRPTDRIIDYIKDDRLINELPKERRNLEKGPDYYDMYRPRKEPPRTSAAYHQMLIDDDTEELEFKELPKCPDPDFEDMVKEEKAKIQIEYELQRRLKQKGYLQTSTDEKEFGAEYDRVPPSQRAKSLQRKLEQESHRELAPNINDLWQKFQEMNQNETASSLDSSRMGAITDLLKNPTKHIVQKIADERTYEKAKERRIMQELTEKARGERRKDTKSERKRQELQNLRRLSEEESNGSYAEILEQEQKRKHKENTKPDNNVDGKQRKEIENKMKGSKKAKIEVAGHVDSIDTLYSIPEDASFEVTPSKTDDCNYISKSKKSRQRHVIDPLMNKLKDKIESQRQKIDKERRKEMKRLEKLKKLEMLLTAKKKGKLSDQAIDVELQYVSTTSVAASSESSTLFGSETLESVESADNKESLDSVTANGDTSTKDSSIEIKKVRTKKVKHGGMLDAYMASIGQGEISDASTEDFQVVRKVRSPKVGKTSDKKKKGKKNKTDNVNFDTEILEKEYKSRERSKSPKSGRKLKDAATMVPSPIVKSPVSKRKVRDVYVKSEAVQTSPSRSWSPPREDQAVISVPLMSSSTKRTVKQFDSRRQRQRSNSPAESYSSTSPNRSVTSRSISPPSRPKTAGRRSVRSKSPPKPRVFLPEPESEEDTIQMKTSPPPKSRMFTPETPDDDLAGKVKDSPNGGLSWFVPMAETKPWRKPLKERQAFSVNQEPWQPKSVSSSTWKNIVSDNPVNKSIGESTQFDLDTTGHYKELEEERSDEENFDPKPLSRLTLQEAFQTFKQDAISKLRARQKRLTLAAKERNLQDMLEKERNRLFAEEKRKKEANPEAHPLSDNLHKPKRRAISKEEMKELTQKLYKKLPEVQNQKQNKKREEEYSLNRLRAKVFNRRVQKNALKNQENRRIRSPSRNIH